MSSDQLKEQRKKELEEKKRRLAEYKEKNQAKPAAASPATTARTTSTASSSSSAATSPSSPAKSKGDDLDKFINSTLSSLVPAPASATATPSKNAAKAGEVPSVDIVDQLIQATSTSSKGNVPPARRKVNLSLTSIVQEIDIAPKETPQYSKATQTLTDERGDDDSSSSLSTDTILHSTSQSRKQQHGNIKRESSSETIDSSNNNNNNNNSISSPSDSPSSETPVPPKELDPEERQRILTSESFADFVTRSSRFVERALSLAEEVDIFTDYGKPLEGASGRNQSRTGEVQLKATLFDERWSKHRSVTDIAWSAKHPDLLLTAYSANEAAGAHDPDGVVLVWSVNGYYQSPEYVFHCQSPVMTSFFSRFHSTLVVGGTYSGQLVIWDTRAKSTPVQRTPLSAVGHTHPIYTMAMVGTQNAHNLVSISTDGKLCVWSMDNLSQPTETLELNNKTGKGAGGVGANVAAPVAVTSLSFAEGDVNGFLVGSEEGAIYQAYRHGTKSGISDRFEGHSGPITGTDIHPSRGSIDFSHLFLSSSTDWTVKLWSTRSAAVEGTSHPGSLYSFEDSSDYVYDARWSPAHPAVFGSVDGSGFLDFYNLNEDTEAPILKTKVTSKALNRMAWSQDGKQLAVGDSGGSVYFYNVGEIGTAQSQDEWNSFETVLAQLSQVKAGALNSGDDDISASGDSKVTTSSDF